MRIDRTNMNRALAKAIAYKECGNDQQARLWARQLVRELGCSDILRAADLTPRETESALRR